MISNTPSDGRVVCFGIRPRVLLEHPSRLRHPGALGLCGEFVWVSLAILLPQDYADSRSPCLVAITVQWCKSGRSSR